MRGRRFWLWVSVLIVVVFCMSDCATIENQIESMTGVEVSESDKQAIVKTTKALRDSYSDITEEEEYYIGRSVSAMILARYPALQNQALNAYVNQVGNAVAVFSERPEIYAGYHFMVLNTDEVNALAAPGGFIFITKGLLKRCRDEEMLGCVLAHEVGHVSAKHGLRSIKKSRLVDAFKVMGQEATRKYGPQELAQLTSVFESVLGDIAEKLIESGYDRKYEYEADELGTIVGAQTGYNPEGLVDFLQTMVDDPGASDKGWFKTHPSAQDRIKRIQKEIGKLKVKPVTQKVRTSRFQQSTKGL